MTTAATILQRLAVMRKLKVPAKVRANCDIFNFGTTERLEVAAGTVGDVVDVTHGGALLLVRWPGSKALHQTSFDVVDVVDVVEGSS